jgi:Bax protein
MIRKIVNILYQILVGAAYTLVIYSIGTFNPNDYVLRDFPEPSFKYSNQEEFVQSLNSCIDMVNTSTPVNRRIPRKMILGQAILETGWGTSRIAKQTNNLFGIKTFKDSIAHAHAVKNTKVMYRVFSTKCDSVREYYRLLNEHEAYYKFRRLRTHLLVQDKHLDPIRLIRTLDNYSETPDYEERVIKVINELETYYK